MIYKKYICLNVVNLIINIQIDDKCLSYRSPKQEYIAADLIYGMQKTDIPKCGNLGCFFIITLFFFFFLLLLLLCLLPHVLNTCRYDLENSSLLAALPVALRHTNAIT
jgi:hypothetical protein